MKHISHKSLRILSIACFLLIIIVTIIPATGVFANLQLYEHYNDSWFDRYQSCDNTWLGQTFTATGNHTVNAVRIYFGRLWCGQDLLCNPGTIHVIIKQVSNTGEPVGQVLSSGTINGNDFPQGYSWHMVTMSGYNLTANARYAIIVYNTSACATSAFAWLIQDHNPYSAGNLIKSDDGGETWTPDNNFDFNFEVWGGPIPEEDTGGYVNYNFLDSSSSNANQTFYSLPADIKVLNILSQPSIAMVGQPVNITANIVNRGNLPGNFNAVLKINDDIETSRQIIVPGNEAVPLEFTVYKENPGNYTIEMNGQIAYFSVTGQNKDNIFNSRNIAYIILGILVLSTVVLLIRYLSTR
jgi:hypothetical protein